LRCGAPPARYGRNRRLTWPAKPPFPASILMSGTGPPVFTASGGPTPPFAGTSDSAPTCRIGLAPGQWRTAQAHSRANRRRNPRSPPIITVTSWVQPENRPDFRPRKPCLARHPRLLTPEPQGPCSLLGAFRRGGRVVECTALEMRHRCKPIGGSNPSLSANIIRHNKTAFQKARQISLILPALAPPAPSAPSPRTPARPATASDPGAAAATPGG
jgi:hypothetical protein